MNSIAHGVGVLDMTVGVAMIMAVVVTVTFGGVAAGGTLLVEVTVAALVGVLESRGVGVIEEHSLSWYCWLSLEALNVLVCPPVEYRFELIAAAPA
jgi:hypothetical protein